MESKNKARAKKYLIRKYFRSKKMQDYLCKQEMPDAQAVDIILGSPDSLENKLNILKTYFYNDKNKNIIELLSEGIENWNAESDRAVFILRTKWFDEDILEEKSSDLGLFRNSLQIIEDINSLRDDWDDYDAEGDEPIEEWYEADKWVLNDDGEYEPTYSYTLIDTTVCFFKRYSYNEKLKAHLPVHGHIGSDIFDSRLRSSSDLNLPIPYEVGDLIKIDCGPFAPVKPVVIVEVFDNYNCCGVEILYRNEDGKYRTSALKHSHMFVDDYTSILSPLYRLDYYDEEFEYKDELLRKGISVTDLIKEKGLDALTDEFIENC